MTPTKHSPAPLLFIYSPRCKIRLDGIQSLQGSRYGVERLGCVRSHCHKTGFSLLQNGREECTKLLKLRTLYRNTCFVIQLALFPTLDLSKTTAG